MYRTKTYQERPLEEIKNEIDLISKFLPQTEKIFLAEGDALNLRTESLVEILDHLSHRFKRLKRISCYTMPKNLLQKSHSDLETLRNRGLGMLYLGIESGNDIVLKKVTKGATPSKIIESCKKAVDHGFLLSCMVILGPGEKAYTFEHIADTARVVSKITPHYLAALNLQLDDSLHDEFMSKFEEPFCILNDIDILTELESLVVLFDPY
jgi:radical SAM superfamily enzyme YgiQ (UPF0313 family)